MFFLELIPGFFSSLFILRRNNIQMVLGMGGYICAPVLLAAIFLKVPFALHEQNFIPGRLNRLFSARSRYFFTSFKDTEKYLKQGRKEIVFSGNPVRKSIKKIDNLVQACLQYAPSQSNVYLEPDFLERFLHLFLNCALLQRGDFEKEFWRIFTLSYTVDKVSKTYKKN